MPKKTNESIAVTSAETSKGQLLARYFHRRAQSAISPTPTFRFGSVQFGLGFLDGSTSPATVGDIPMDSTVSDITNVYTDVAPAYLYDEGTYQTRIRAEIPHGAAGIPAGGVDVNVACILDEAGEAIIMIASQLTVINSGRAYVVTAVIETNLA